MCNRSKDAYLEEETVNMTCVIEYHGGRWRPVFQWTRNSQPFNPSSTINSTNKVISTYTYVATPDNSDDVYNVSVGLHETSTRGENEAQNIPEYHSYYQFTPIEVLCK